MSDTYAVYGEPESIASVRAEPWSGLEDSLVGSVESMLVSGGRKASITYAKLQIKNVLFERGIGVKLGSLNLNLEVRKRA